MLSKESSSVFTGTLETHTHSHQHPVRSLSSWECRTIGTPTTDCKISSVVFFDLSDKITTHSHLPIKEDRQRMQIVSYFFYMCIFSYENHQNRIEKEMKVDD